MVRKPEISKKEIVAEEIINRIMDRDADHGGILMSIVGLQGSGKTSLTMTFADMIMEKHPKEILFWRDSLDSSAQFTRIGKGKWEIFAEAPIKLGFRDIEKGTKLSIPYKTFSDFDDLYRQCKPQQLNVVYFKEVLTWVSFIDFLRLLAGWQDIFADEWEDLAPCRCKGEQWHKNEWFGNNAKQIRKGLVSFFGNTQNSSDLDWRVLSKVMMTGYLQGAKVDYFSPLHQNAVNCLSIGSAWLDWGRSKYGKIFFKSYPPIRPIFEVNYIKEE